MSLLVVTAALAAYASRSTAEPAELTLYSYHAAPPFTANAIQQTGLTFDLLSVLQQLLGSGGVQRS
jgi:hypothetical protein